MMTSSITLGRIAGIRIGIHWSWLVVFGLITWSLATAVFPDQNPGLGDSTYIAMAIVAAVLFFTSLLMHELGHAFQARREGMEIDGITLWLFGGVAQFRGMFPRAGAEFRIAIAGPLVSLVLGAGFVGVASRSPAWRRSTGSLRGSATSTSRCSSSTSCRRCRWTAAGCFGPPSGPRERLQLGDARRGGDRARVRRALHRGRLALFFFESGTSGLWLAFLGWFLFGAASEEARYAQVHRAFSGLRVRDLMIPAPTAIAPGQTIGELMDGVVGTNRQDAYPVVDDGGVVGLLPFRVIADVPRGEWDARTVGERMLPLAVVPVLKGDDSLEQALAALSRGIDRGLVVDDGQVSGVLSLADLARAVQSRSPGR